MLVVVERLEVHQDVERDEHVARHVQRLLPYWRLGVKGREAQPLWQRVHKVQQDGRVHHVVVDAQLGLGMQQPGALLPELQVRKLGLDRGLRHLGAKQHLGHQRLQRLGVGGRPLAAAAAAAGTGRSPSPAPAWPSPRARAGCRSCCPPPGPWPGRQTLSWGTCAGGVTPSF
eukprot:SAG22_NODE_1335_length_4700_cov_2.556183_4_plen_172_part_00